VDKDRSTLLTSPLSMADFLARLVFFASAPFAIVLAAELFPVRGALVDVGLALMVFLLGEAARRGAARFRPLGLLLREALAFESYYRERQPRSFAYYVAYPLLFPYWLSNREARREFWMFRYTLASFSILLVSLAWQYLSAWRPQLGFRDFLPAVLISLAVETLLVLSLLMPIATTVVWYHGSHRRRRLLVILLVGTLSTMYALTRVLSHRDPIVSYLTRERVRLRTNAARKSAHRTLQNAVEVAWRDLTKEKRGVQEDGKVEGKALSDARLALEAFYKHDEAFAFDLWASPRIRPRVLVLYAQSRRKRSPIWVALKDGAELRKPDQLPRGAFFAMRAAADTTDPVRMVWED